MKIEILMLLESEMKGNNPTILNENEYEIEEIELFDEDDDYDQYDAKGFITLYGLPIKVKAKLDQKKKK